MVMKGERAPTQSSRKGEASPDPRLAEAERLMDQNKIGDAFRAAQAVLRDDPTDWRGLEFVAPLLLAMNHIDMGLGALDEAMRHAPESADIQRRLTFKLLQAALKTGRGYDRAVAAGQQTLARHGPDAKLYNNLIQALAAADRHDEATKTADMAIAAFPDTRALRFNKSHSLLRLGKLEESVEIFSGGLLQLGSNPGKSTDELRRQYESLAAGYDDNLLHRSFTERVARFARDVVGSIQDKHVLDAGCGTGLLAAHLDAARLVGIDLSPDMLAKARGRGIYDELIEGDIIRAMAARTDRFDLVISTAALCHIADLAPFFQESFRLLSPGGHLLFSVDPATDAFDVACSFPGEFAHSRAYMRRLGSESGFVEIAIKIMEHRAMPGFWCAFRRVR